MWLRSAKLSRRFLLILWLNFLLTTTYSLKCRSEDGPSDAELKRVARTCMHKMSENSYSSKRSSSGSGQASGGTNRNNYYGQQHDQQFQYGQNANNKNYNAYDDDMQQDDNAANNYRGNNNNNNNYDRSNSNDMLKQRNRDRLQNNHASRSQRSANTLFNFERITNGNGRYDQTSNGAHNSNGGGGSNGAGNNNNNNGGSSNRDHRSSASSNNNYSNSNHNGKYNNSSHDRDRQSQDSACIVHCFFEEMNMLNKDDYPDKHKVNYLLVKDIRDRELRSFYTETIQECFHYLDSQHRRDKCHFSRDLIHCMSEYAKANCDDWNDYNVIFN